MSSLKSPCRTSYWSSIETIALNGTQTNKQVDERTDGQNQRVKALSLSQAVP